MDNTFVAGKGTGRPRLVNNRPHERQWAVAFYLEIGTIVHQCYGRIFGVKQPDQ